MKNKYVPIVAVGASAGGLESVSQLLSKLEPGFSYAVVILQHLSPNYKSMMPELLMRETRLHVQALDNQVLPEAGTVYVVPPNSNAIVQNGEISLHDAPPEISPKPSINEFFISLAEEYAEKSVGVILSGTGSDGTAGLRAIQAAGGITIAQQPETAKYEGMPLSAIESGVTDFVLAPDAIAEKLMQLPDALLHKADFSPSVLQKVLSILNSKCELDFSGYKVGTLSRRIRRRMVATNHLKMESYLEWIANNPEETELLAKDILISVTAFFRDQDSFAALKKSLSEQIKGLTVDEEFRVWVAGCATGEEAYSIAIILAEEFLEAGISNPIQVFATDIDDDALNYARGGVYPEQALVHLPEVYIGKYFISHKDKSYEVNKKLRDMIVFARHNVINDPPFLRLNLITCRNVLIYFDNALQAKVLSRFHFALRDHGQLFLGRSESVAQAEQLFTFQDRRERIFLKSGESRPVLDSPLSKRLSTLPVRKKESPQYLIDSLMNYQNSTVALCSSEGKVLQTSGQVDSFFRFPSGASDISLFEVIVPSFKSELMALYHQLKKSSKAQRSRVLPFNDSNWQFTLTYTLAGGENRILLLIEPTKEKAAEKSYLNYSQPYSDELQVTQEQLQSLIEELATANEEMQSLNEEAQASNEELQATNEELEAANEELQATNEELVSVNEELGVKTSELSILNEEYAHLYDSFDFPVLVFDKQLKLVRYNYSASFTFNLRSNARNQSVERLTFPPYMQEAIRLLGITASHGDKQELFVEELDSFYQILIHPGMDELGDVEFIVLNIIDITEIQNTRNELTESEARIKTIMDNTTVQIAMKDLQGNYLYVNDSFLEGYGIERENYIGKSDFELFPESFASQLWSTDLKAIRSLQVEESECTMVVNGRDKYFSTRHQVLRDHRKKPSMIITESEDITNRKKAEEKLKIAARVYQQAGEAIVVTSKTAEILSINDAFTDITGYEEHEAVGLKMGDLLNSGRHSADFFKAMWEALEEKGHWQGEIWNRKKNGDIYPEWLTVNCVNNELEETDFFIAVFSDISNLKESQRKVEFLATHDALTGLPNRSLFNDRLDNALARAKRSQSSVAVLFLDLDDFKSINDTLGHDIGDQLLIEVSKTLQHIIRDIDTVSRLGGDEFTVILGDCDPAEAQHISERIIESLEEPILIGDRKIFTSVSIGIALYPDDGESSVSMLKSADTAMYKAKELGRNQFRFFHSEMRDQIVKQSTMEGLLRDAIKNRNFRLVYQPKYSAQIENKLIGAEALLRWRDSNLGEISPVDFIPIAEKGASIIELSNLVIEMVAEQIARWLSHGLKVPTISLNLSAQCLKLENYAQDLVDIIDSYIVPHDRVMIEITESSLMDQSNITANNLNVFQNEKLSISIDDFGTGYSSLNYLKQLPLSELKVDKSFVDGLGIDEDDEAICKAILSMSAALKLNTVAEGVETEAQKAWLQREGCDQLQGFLLNKPMEVADFETLLSISD